MASNSDSNPRYMSQELGEDAESSAPHRGDGILSKRHEVITVSDPTSDEDDPSDDHDPSDEDDSSDDHDSSDEQDELAATDLDSESGETEEIKYERLLSDFDQNYAQILNERTMEDSFRCDSSVQIGAVTWTAEEREQFFRAITTKSRSSLRAVSQSIPSKSEAEVYGFLCVLQSEVRELKEQAGDGQKITLADVPAAVELSASFEAVLERFADAMIARDQLHTAMVSMNEPSLRLIGSRRAAELDEITEDFETEYAGEIPVGDVGLRRVVEGIPGRGLFCLPAWIELTRKVFMNTGPTGDPNNWTTHAAVDETPSINHSAFEDFHQLALFHLRKLIQTAIHCATSRQKAQEKRGYSSEHLVCPADIEAAMELLGVTRDRSDFWKTLVRRNRLQVVIPRRRRPIDDARLLTLEQAEEALSKGLFQVDEAGSASDLTSKKSTHTLSCARLQTSDEDASDSAQGGRGEDSGDVDSDMHDTDDGKDSGESETGSGTIMDSESDPELSLDAEQDRILNAVDDAVSREHDFELHQRLGLSPVEAPLSDEPATVAGLRSLDDAQSNEDHTEWRESITTYSQDWENSYADRLLKRKREVDDLE